MNRGIIRVGVGLMTASLTAAMDNPAPILDRIATLETKLEHHPDDLNALGELGTIFESLAADDRAEPLYTRALTIDPDQIEIRLKLAQLLNRDGLTVEAEDVLRKGLNQSPENLSLRLALAESQLAVRYAAGAEATLKSGLQWHKKDPRLRFLLGQVRVMNGDTETALGDLQAATSLPLPSREDPDGAGSRDIHARASYTLALLAVRRNDDAAREHHLQACLRHQARHPEALLMSAALATEQQKFETAVAHLTNLLDLPIDQRPSENDVLRDLPFPDGLHVWALALAATGNRDAALHLLVGSAKSARKRERRELAEKIQTWADTLPPSP